MQWQSTSYTLPALITSLVAAALMAFAMRQRHTEQMWPFAVLTAAVAFWTLGYAAELASVSLTAKLWFAKFQYIGIVTPPVAWLAYAAFYVGRPALITRRRMLLAALVPWITVLLVFTNEWHHLIWASAELETYRSWTMLSVTYGLWFWVHTIYSYIFLAVGTLFLFQGLVLSSALYQNQIIIMVLGALGPWIANALYISGLSPFPYLDLTPFGFTISSIIFGWGMLRFRLFDVLPIARDIVMDNLNEGVIVLDQRNQIIDINRQAARLLNLQANTLLGSAGDDLLLNTLKLAPLVLVSPEWRQEVVLRGPGAVQQLSLAMSPLMSRRGKNIGRLIVLSDISQRKIAEQELRRQALVVANIQDVVMVAGPDGLFVDVNTAVERLLGYTKADLIGQAPNAFLNRDPATLARYTEIPQAIQTQGSWRGELQFRRKQGGSAIVDLVIVPLLDANQQLIGTVGVGRDIAERKRIELELRRQALTFENILDSVVVTNQDGVIVDCNPATENVFGYTKAELIGQPAAIWQLNLAEREQLSHYIRDGLDGAEHWQGEVNFIRKYGRAGVCEIVVVPLFDTEQQRIGAIAVSRDVTESKAIAANLLAQKNLFKNLVEVAKATTAQPNLEDTLQNTLTIAVQLTKSEQGSIFLIDQTQRVTHSISSRSDLAFTKRQHLISRFIQEGLAGWVIKHQEIVLIDDAALDARWIADPESTYAARSVLAIPIQGSTGLLGLLMLLHSVSHHFSLEHTQLMQAAVAQMSLAIRNAHIFDTQQQLTAELVRAKEAAEQTSRAKSQFLDNISHELRTPLTAIMGYSDLLLDEMQDAAVSDYLYDVQKIRSASHHLLALINDVLDLSKIEAGKMTVYWERTDLDLIMADVLTTVQPLVDKNHNRLTLAPATPLGLLVTDVSKLRQVLINLLSNAAKFTERGELRIEVRRSDAPDPQIHFAIHDTGIGISPDQLGALFQSFSQADASTTRKYGGTGLGLVISRNLCRLLGGDIAVVSALDQGSTFTVSLPIVEVPSEPVAAPAPLAAPVG